MFKKLKGHCSKAGNIYHRGEEEGGAILHFPYKVAYGEEEKGSIAVCKTWFPEYRDGSNTGATYQMRLKANAVIIALPGKAKQNDKQYSKQQKLKAAIKKPWNLMYSKKGSKQWSR